MVNLKGITGEVCPICVSSLIVKEWKDHKHVNGYWNQYREFDCGYRLHFSPNFMRTDKDKYSSCEHDPVIIARDEKRVVAKARLTRYIERYLDADNEWKVKLEGAISYV